MPHEERAIVAKSMLLEDFEDCLFSRIIFPKNIYMINPKLLCHSFFSVPWLCSRKDQRDWQRQNWKKKQDSGKSDILQCFFNVETCCAHWILFVES